jgi:hypothetical protein
MRLQSSEALLAAGISRGIEDFVDHFAFVVEKAGSSEWSKPLPRTL